MNIENESPINEMNSRTAMGLTAEYYPSKVDDLRVEIEALSRKSDEELAALVESRYHENAIRYSAGTILALRGDLRISARAPSMIFVPGAVATLGLDPNKVDNIVEQYRSYGVIRDWIMKECPEYKAVISSFKIGKYCVTNQEFREFLSCSGYEGIPSSWDFGYFPIHKANHPVFTISPEDAEAYCGWLSKETGRSFRLPSEEEWEYVAGGSERYEFPWGDRYAEDHANTIEEKMLTTTPIGMYPRGNSPFGVMDMAGNVEEYTSSDYSAYTNGEVVSDDLLASEGPYRVARGGSFTRFRDLARTRRRHGWYKKDIYVMGFRLAEHVNDGH